MCLYQVYTDIYTNSNIKIMATFKTCVIQNKRRRDGFWQVFIRVIQHQKIAYIPTNKYVNEHGLSSKSEVSDPYIMEYCLKKITHWMDRLNRVESENWTVKEIVEYVKNDDGDVCFSDYARQHNANMVNSGMERTAKNYRLAYESLERFAGTNKVSFSMLTSAFLMRWIKTLEHTHRAKEKYPICVRQIFKAALLEFNDEERGVVRIKFNPWPKIQIPRPDKAEQLAILPEECRDFFNAPVPESRFVSPLPELGRDVAMMVLCLGGINAVDLYNMKKEDYYNGILHYKRAKTKKFRADEAYMEMRVPPIIMPLMEKYKAANSDCHLFCFSARHTTSDSFNSNVNIGIKKICESMNMPKEKWYSVYTFRHTWGTIAQNDCGASIAEVAFGMNHSAGHNVTRGYLKLDFTPAWELNEKVVEFVFFTQKKGRRAAEQEVPPCNVFERFSPYYMMRGEAFFRGKLLGVIEDTGFNNVDEIIDKLVPFVPDSVPVRCNVMFRITNLDKQQTAIYERMKGKGF